MKYDHLRPRCGYNGWRQKEGKMAFWSWFNVPLRVWRHQLLRIDTSDWGANSCRKSWCFIWPTMDSCGYFCDDFDNSVLHLSMEVRPTSPSKISMAKHKNVHYVPLKMPWKCRTLIDGVGFGQSIDWLVLRSVLNIMVGLALSWVESTRRPKCKCRHIITYKACQSLLLAIAISYRSILYVFPTVAVFPTPFLYP